MKNTIFDRTGRTALVTGGSKGIGNAIARGFANAGADLFLCSRTEEPLAATADAIRQQTQVRVEYVVADMANREDVDRVANEAAARLGKVDILVNNAGWNVPQAIDAI
jgi:short-subunit dehydrogenase